ncbi:DUF551 domain-containing protein [Stutzerimonas chloritidismutans]
MSEWISVEDRIPTDDYDGVGVIVAVVNHRGETVAETDAWMKASGGGYFDFWKDKVSHWQPLPSPPPPPPQ